MGRTRLAAVVVLVAVSIVAAGCGGDDDDAATTQTSTGSGTSGAGEGPVTLPVQVDALPDEFSASFFAYFPDQLRARPGDTVSFTSRFTGEPHTVAFGTLLDTALDAFAAVPAGTAPSADVQALLARVPSFFSPTETRVDADPQPAAAQPCFLASGDPPAVEACADQPAEPPAFDGTQSFFSSGFLPDEATFDVKLADGIAPGTYRFMCLVDRTEMTGVLTVVEPGQSVPAPADVRTQAEVEIEGAVDALRDRAATAKAVTTADAATAGAPEPAEAPATAPGGRTIDSTVNVFPDEVSVPVGGAVNWTVHGAHMIAFNAAEDARPLYAFDASGVVRANKKGANPSGSPPRPAGARPPVVVNAGQFDGTGFRNSGLLVGEGDLSWRLTFTKAGTYTYLCLFHTDMEGSVKVG
jgi:plastocyanin